MNKKVKIFKPSKTAMQSGHGKSDKWMFGTYEHVINRYSGYIKHPDK